MKISVALDRLRSAVRLVHAELSQQWRAIALATVPAFAVIVPVLKEIDGQLSGISLVALGALIAPLVGIGAAAVTGVGADDPNRQFWRAVLAVVVVVGGLSVVVVGVRSSSRTPDAATEHEPTTTSAAQSASLGDGAVPVTTTTTATPSPAPGSPEGSAPASLDDSPDGNADEAASSSSTDEGVGRGSTSPTPTDGAAAVPQVSEPGVTTSTSAPNSAPNSAPTSGAPTPPITAELRPPTYVTVFACGTWRDDCDHVAVFAVVPTDPQYFLQPPAIVQFENHGVSLLTDCWTLGAVTYNWSKFSEPPVEGPDPYESPIYFHVKTESGWGYIADTYSARDQFNRLGLTSC